MANQILASFIVAISVVFGLRFARIDVEYIHKYNRKKTIISVLCGGPIIWILYPIYRLLGIIEKER